MNEGRKTERKETRKSRVVHEQCSTWASGDPTRRLVWRETLVTTVRFFRRGLSVPYRFNMVVVYVLQLFQTFETEVRTESDSPRKRVWWFEKQRRALTSQRHIVSLVTDTMWTPDTSFRSDSTLDIELLQVSTFFTLVITVECYLTAKYSGFTDVGRQSHAVSTS